MKVIATITLGLSAATALAASEPPEIGTGTNVPGRTTSQPGATSGKFAKRAETTEIAATDAALASARAMAGCAVTKRPADVEALLNANDRASFEIGAQKLTETLGKCAIKGAEQKTNKVRFSFGGSTYYGLLSEAWLARKNFRRVAQNQYDPQSQSLQWLAGGESDLVLLRLADCIAHREPVRVEFLVRSAPMSAQEVVGFSGVQSMLAGCLDSNVTLSATKTKLRLALAGALYRRSLEAVRPIEAAK